MISIQHLPLISAVIAHMDEGLAVFDEKGELVVANAIGQCCAHGHKTIRETLETEVVLGDSTFVAKMYVVDHKGKSCDCC